MSSLKDKKSLKIELAAALIPAWVATGPAEAVIGRIVDIGSDGARSPQKHGRVRELPTTAI